MSIRKIATYFKSYQHTILNLMKRFFIPTRTRSLANKISNRRGSGHPRWIGGSFVTPQGYRLVMEKGHPYSIDGGYVLYHRLVVENHLSRYLRPEEVVHHINGKRDDNRLENLMVFPDSKTHLKYHAKMRRYKGYHE